MKQEVTPPLNFVMWGISKEELESILDDAMLSPEEKQTILEDYNDAEE
ncbi:hypothetical protein [Microscilla marina]|uniref:Uncharacterized protein n=1 Tax=Microscilla marina ATCC 23134 TaxID=313606 RepID=A1ZJ67_MICM2|nr:hypothetical protein [Microscilla marina]EAY29603.1 hypothetical protein M23134_00487 [Microscilla marina ATCC 23134]